MFREVTIKKIGELRVMLMPDDRQIVRAKIVFGSGAREEVAGKLGVAHFLEHLVFKGTEKYPHLSDIDRAIEMVGGYLNAYTDYEDMGFSISVTKDQLNLALDILSQLVSFPLLSEEYFEQERGTILEEEKMYQDRPDSKAAIELAKIQFKNTRLSTGVIGDPTSLLGLKTADLIDYAEKWFRSDNAILGIYGGYGDEASLLRLIEKKFQRLIDTKETSSRKYHFDWPEQTKKQTIVTRRSMAQANLAMAWRGVDLFSAMRPALYLIDVLLGGSSVSRLYQELREKRGWAYSVGSNVDMGVDMGTISVGGGFPKGKINDSLKLIDEIVYSLAKGKWQITEKELEDARVCYLGRVAMSFDDPSKIIGGAIYSMMFENKVYSFEEIQKKVRAVTIEDIRETCKVIFDQNLANVSVVGDVVTSAIDG